MVKLTPEDLIRETINSAARQGKFLLESRPYLPNNDSPFSHVLEPNSLLLECNVSLFLNEISVDHLLNPREHLR